MKNKKKIIKKIVIICISVIVLELLIMLTMKIINERNIAHVDSLNDIILVDNYYIGVGTSDFSDSKFVKEKSYLHNNKNVLATQAKIVKYDLNKNIIWENTIAGDYDSTFYSVIQTDDGFLAVGSYVSKYEQIDVNTRDAIIVKYDINGKRLWQKDYRVLSDTEFYKIIDDGNDNYVIIGQSIYENFEMGYHIIGGGIITRFDKEGKLLAQNNYGGNKSGSFNDIIKTDDGYIVCGKDASNYGIVVKFKKDFNRDDSNVISNKILWQRTYSNTDTIGFTNMIKIDNILYVVGAINISKEQDQKGNPIYKYDAGIVTYNTSGKYLGKYSLLENTYHRFNSVIKENNNLVLTGVFDVDNKEKKSSFITKFNLDNNKFGELKIIKEKNDYLINRIVKLDNTNYLIGTSKTKCGLLGCEYKIFINEYK